MIVSQLKNAQLCSKLLHQLECLTITRGCHQVVVSRQSSIPSPVHWPLNLTATVPVRKLPIKTQCGTLTTRHPVTHMCVGVNIVPIVGDRINTNLTYKCPQTRRSVVEITPPPSVQNIIPLEIPGLHETERLTPGVNAVEKLAINDLMRIRRRRMKKHRRSRLKDKIWPSLKKSKYLKVLKKEKERKAVLARIKSQAEKYDPMAVIKEKLEIAKQNGFFVDIFSGKSAKFVRGCKRRPEIKTLQTFYIDRARK